jgi:hypothetical protein
VAFLLHSSTYFSARRSAWGCGVDLFVFKSRPTYEEADSDLSFLVYRCYVMGGALLTYC